MIVLKNKKTEKVKKILCYVLVLAAIATVGASVSVVSAYNCRPGDTECENAKANMEENKSKATEYNKKADSVGEIIEQLSAEIGELNQIIAENEIKIKTLNQEIKKTEQKLEEEQSALAEMLINMHFSDDSEPIRILAGSKSISDYAEKQAREEVAKQEIVATSEKVKQTKEELNQEKEEVEATLRENENSRTVLATKQADQRDLKEAYEKNADDAAATASYWEKQVQAMAWTPPSTSTGNGSRWYGTGNTYPYQDRCSYDYNYSTPGNWWYPYGGLICQCTDYVSYKAYEKWGIKNTWGGDAWKYIYAGGRTVPNNGATTYVDKNPAPNSIAIWPPTGTSSYGHVQWVESVNADGSINVTEYNVNWPSIGCYEKDFCSRSNVGSAGASFLHFE